MGGSNCWRGRRRPQRAGFAGNDPEKVEALQPNLEEEREPGAAIAEALGLPKPLASVPVDREREEDEEGPL